MRIFWVIFFLSFAFFETKFLYGQSKKPNDCSMVFNEVSYFWKLDSLGTNGARLFSYKKLLNCIKDSVSVSFLIEKLGTPNRMRTTNKGVEYIYNYLDLKAIAKPEWYPFIISYISFMFDNKKEALLSIFEGDSGE